jgi:ParB family chromosome partitioning protein
MAAWWKPTAEGYFNHVSKAVILEAVQQFAPEQVTRLSTLKKADIASEAERLADGTGWMPVVFKDEVAQGVEAQTIQEVVEEPDPTEADDEAHGHTLTA